MMTIPLSLLVAHFLGDFVLQNDWMAQNKSKDIKALVFHTWVYSLCFAAWGAEFWVMTWLTHFFTDAVTSRITSKLWFVRVIEPHNGPGQKFYGAFDCGNRHYFFVMIGFDQLIHFVTLAATLRLLS